MSELENSQVTPETSDAPEARADAAPSMPAAAPEAAPEAAAAEPQPLAAEAVEATGASETAAASTPEIGRAHV